MEKIYSKKDKEGPYINNIEKMDPGCTTEYTRKVDRQKVILENIHSNCTRSRLEIQLTQS